MCMPMPPISEPFLSLILVHYSALVPVKNISFPSNISFHVAHDFFLRKILQNHHLKQYPPSESYQQSFWKWALVGLESLIQNNEDDEVDESIYAHYLSLRSENRSEAPPHSFITYYWKFPEIYGHPIEDCHETITLLESRTTIETGTTGLRTWRAGLVLAQYLVQHPHLVDTSNVLELGSGIGFIGILIASLQLHTAHTAFDHEVPSIYMTDVNSTVLARCQNNVKLACNKSSSHPNVHYAPLDWLDALSGTESMVSFFSEVSADIILGADVVFDPALIPPLVKTIFLALSSERTQLALIALTVRNEETLKYFLDEIGKVLKAKEVTYNASGNLLLPTHDQVDAGLEVKIFRVVRSRGT